MKSRRNQLGGVDVATLRRTIRRSLKSRGSNGLRLRQQVAGVIAQLRAQGTDDTTIRASLAGVTLDVASSTGNDRIDIVTRLPRRQFVMNRVDEALNLRELIPRWRR